MSPEAPILAPSLLWGGINGGGISPQPLEPGAA